MIRPRDALVETEGGVKEKKLNDGGGGSNYGGGEKKFVNK